MDKVSSARDSGIFFRTYNKHDGVYLGRATVDADLPGGMLFLRITNYTSKMENVYCLFYEMDGPNNVQTCHSQALLLRNVGEYSAKAGLGTNIVSALVSGSTGLGSTTNLGTTLCRNCVLD